MLLLRCGLSALHCFLPLQSLLYWWEVESPQQIVKKGREKMNVPLFDRRDQFGFECFLLRRDDPDKESQELMEQLDRLRTRIWSQEGREVVAAGTFERDRFDEPTAGTVYIVVTIHEEGREVVVGGFRLIKSAPYDLPVAKYASSIPQNKEALEISRWCMDPSFSATMRLKAHEAMIKLALIYPHTQHWGTAVYMDVCVSLFRLLERKGVVVRMIGQRHDRPDGIEYVPAVLDVSSSLDNIFERQDKKQQPQEVQAA